MTTLTGANASSKMTVIACLQATRDLTHLHKRQYSVSVLGLAAETTAGVLFLLDKEEYFVPSVAAISRHLRNYNLKGRQEENLFVSALNMKGEIVKASKEVKATSEGVAWACQMVDAAPTSLNRKHFY